MIMLLCARPLQDNEPSLQLICLAKELVLPLDEEGGLSPGPGLR